MTNCRSKNIVFITIMLLLGALFILDPSYASTATSGLGRLDGVLESIVQMMTGTTAKFIAIICVAAVGIGWMYGFIDLRKAAYCILGIGIVFGANALVAKLTGIN
ncbi:TrbC/VirB2 family protein [Bartonella phoceensis]|uniref:TrbC/VirB2 family protein n=1 Tax=Bartonella phoceensis TaxID=270249 RepID=UPI001ABA92BB|nr:TrbC/VirB2 family protein [Bartonella phoceensis]